MNDAVKGFTDDDLRTFADTISRLPPPRPTADTTDPARMARGQALARQHRCNVCHNPDLAGHGHIARVAGQPEGLLVKAKPQRTRRTIAGHEAAKAAAPHA